MINVKTGGVEYETGRGDKEKKKKKEGKIISVSLLF